MHIISIVILYLSLSVCSFIVGRYPFGRKIFRPLAPAVFLLSLTLTLVWGRILLQAEHNAPELLISLIFIFCLSYAIGRVNRYYKGSLLFYGKTQYYKDFFVFTKDNTVSMKGFGGDETMSELDYKAYAKIIELIKVPKTLLFLGGGAYIAPRYFYKKYKDIKVDVVEIDEVMIKLSQKYFNFNNQNIHTIHKPARSFIDYCRTKYDMIFVDITMGRVFKRVRIKNPLAYFPNNIFHQELLTYTIEAFTKMRTMLNTKGVIVINLMGTVDGEAATFWKKVYANVSYLFTYCLVFPQHKYFRNKQQNIILICGNSEILGSKKNLIHSISKAILSEKEKIQLATLLLDRKLHISSHLQKLLRDKDLTRWRYIN
ncbi:MAG: hypothetical protein A2900_01225 [Candidatus Chisholmbacteria bacterium RIFCSPLOWO2_01_FULL_50_28]|uniref:PABS domain-containing protein n=1 Tax=Candidatus Chisholmbacteria bacterium RIFCSPHIGHO2_01_FULL_52_32 TaxID=1797591 RepID=A0A1G1VUM0_9BACT|nr:MAG: hypothetical protein A2786_06285 [Candidatus Chisholmbacteria bacterium RIFCSPHIGHO2_01_FULL_52_32]OGY19710.1 MAG: hypothetical protein A2900_01225 [Candidatus Chisholmbacteria bacterium RIFCSPLOWO2_01_FULL_50_28]